MYNDNLEKILLSGTLITSMWNNSAAGDYIEDWILEYGSNYLRNLYPNFLYYRDIFLQEYFSVYALDGWELHDYNGLSKIEFPSESQLMKFITACNKLKNIKPFCYGTPTLYRGTIYLYLGYRIYSDTILAKRIKEI